MPYSVSMPSTFAIALELEILPRTHVLDRATTLDVVFFSVDQRANENDPFALLARNTGPIIGVCCVRKVLVLAELLTNRFEEILFAKAPPLICDLTLDRDFLGPANNVFDHGARCEVFEVQNLFVAALVGDLKEAILVVDTEHVRNRFFDHRLNGLGAITATEFEHRVLVERQLN